MTQGWKTFKHKILPRSLYARSLMIIVVPILLMQMIVTYVFFDRHWQSTTDKLVFALSGEIRYVIADIRHAKTDDDMRRIIEAARKNFYFRISIESKRRAARHRASSEGLAWYSVEAKLQKSLTEGLKRPFSITTNPKQDHWFDVSVQMKDGRVIRIECYNRRIISPTTYIFILWLIGSSIVLMAVSVLFMRNQIRPIHRLALAAEKLGKGQEVANFKIEGAREVRKAARAFLDMQSRIRRQIDQRTAMLAGVSHDLRTPLTRMKLQLAMAGEGEGVAELRQDAEEMEKMLEGYLTFARGEGDEQSEHVDVKALLQRVAANARRQGAAVEEAYGEGGFLLRARPVALERAIANVVGNACKYAKTVHLALKEDLAEEAVEVFIDDDGPGIPEAQREEVFRPFTRLEKSRNPKTGGIGLGLSIAQDIVHGHGGEISLGTSPQGGLRVIIRLPA